MMGPALLLIFALAVYPMLYMAAISFMELDMIKGSGEFVGFQHYIMAMQSQDFRSSLLITLRFAFLSIVIQMPLGILVALLLNREFHGRWLLRSLVLLPWTVPTLVNATLWSWIYNPQYGALNRLLLQLGWIEAPVIWLATPNRAMAMILLADTWRVLPLYVLMILASLQTIPKTQMESAVLDGAGPVRRLIHIIMPLIKPMVMVVLVMRTMQALKVFDIVYMLTRGGPMNSTMVISYFIYNQSFSFMKFSYGSALAVIVAMISIIIAAVYMRALRTDDIY